VNTTPNTLTAQTDDQTPTMEQITGERTAIVTTRRVARVRASAGRRARSATAHSGRRKWCSRGGGGRAGRRRGRTRRRTVKIGADTSATGGCDAIGGMLQVHIKRGLFREIVEVEELREKGVHRKHPRISRLLAAGAQKPGTRGGSQHEAQHITRLGQHMCVIGELHIAARLTSATLRLRFLGFGFRPGFALQMGRSGQTTGGAQSRNITEGVQQKAGLG
jgi:hypothetical protein